jgi:hypothetical protein
VGRSAQLLKPYQPDLLPHPGQKAAPLVCAPQLGQNPLLPWTRAGPDGAWAYTGTTGAIINTCCISPFGGQQHAMHGDTRRMTHTTHDVNTIQ